jgi:uncharacterized protein with HEPN domain
MSPPRDLALRLHDILEAIAVIQDTLGTTTYDEFLRNHSMRWSIERGIEIISEASRHIPGELKAREPGIDWKGVAGIGNILRHDYADVANDVIYKTATARITELDPAIRRLIAFVEG